jgi:glutamine synthetase
MHQKIKKILNKFYHRGLFPAFGVEIEFYILGYDESPKVEELISMISDATGLKVQKEKGYRQYEIASNIFSDVFQMIDFVKTTRKIISNMRIDNSELYTSFHPKPYKNDYGSAMHLHLSLNDDDGFNIFNNYDNIESNNILTHAIGGVLKLLNRSLYMITGNDESEFNRFCSNYMSPTKICWGKNNRTTAIRIPDSDIFSRNRRIEFRIPSAQACIIKVALYLLTSTLYGINNSIVTPECVYGNACDDIYDLEKIHSSLEEAKKDFRFWEIFEDICKSI